LLDQKVAKKSSRTEAVSGISPPATKWVGGVARSEGVVFLTKLSTYFRIVFFDLQKRPPRPYIAIARLSTPPFFFFEKVGGEIRPLSVSRSPFLY
jgi:hypothetical protein